MAASPSENASDVIKLSMKVANTDVTDNVRIHRVYIRRMVNRVSTAEVELLDGDIAEQTFPESDKTDFAPGEEIEILAGYGDDETSVFKGIILKHGVSVSGNNNSYLKLECKDAAVKMTVGRKSGNYNVLASGDSIKDSEVISEIIGNYSELTPEVDATTTELSSLVQYATTDWDFVVSRAEANAMVVLNSNGTLAVKAPDFSSSAVLTLTYGTDIYNFNATIDPTLQMKQVTSVTWNAKTQASLEESVASPSDSSEQAKTNGALDSVIELDDFRLQSQAPLESTSLKDWANAQLLKNKISLIRGHVSFQGSALVDIGDMVELQNVGKRFNGTVFCGAVEHIIENGTWVTDVELGCSPQWFSSEMDVSAPAASGLLPAANGLQTGVVTKLDEDPNGECRIQVKLPVLGASQEGIWARLAHGYASNGFGSFFIPEVGDEVVLGYMNDDPCFPVVLGSLYSSKQASPVDLTAENYTKQITTKTELKIQFDDEKKIITLETPGGHSVVMDDDGQSITLTDSNGNCLEMGSSGISMSSPKDITLKADGNISLTATGNIESTATGDLSADGMNVNLTATTALAAKGSASAEISASGNTTVKGAMVMIN